jgi:ectoine hydroxylase-related dioxygenase (phytanoyl-CoA dioxygenase family)
MLTKSQLKHYYEKGYVKFKYPVKKNLINFKIEFAQQILISFKKKMKSRKFNLKNYKKLHQILHKGMIELDRVNHNFLVEIYNSLPRSVSFYKIISDPKMTEIVNQLLGNKKLRNLYINSNSVRMDVPKSKKFMYGWHQDFKSNINNSKFIQLWLPATDNITKRLGGLNILETSFNYDLKTTHTAEEIRRLKSNLPLRANYNTKLLERKNYFKKKNLTCKFGEGILFNSKLMHKSGLNESKNMMRYIITCFYHDILNPNWEFKLLDHKKMNIKY